MAIIYTRQGDYYLPDLTLPEQPQVELGVYAQFRRSFLKQHHKILYYNLLTSCTLIQHLYDTEQAALAMEDMTAVGTTKIWPVKDSLIRVLDYASNPEKTIYSDLRSVLHYAGRENKTTDEEKACYVTGVNCNSDTAFKEMRAVKERFGKVGGNVAYHAYQSFKRGEVTPEKCHQIGVELAKKCGVMSIRLWS